MLAIHFLEEPLWSCSGKFLRYQSNWAVRAAAADNINVTGESETGVSTLILSEEGWKGRGYRESNGGCFSLGATDVSIGQQCHRL